MQAVAERIAKHSAVHARTGCVEWQGHLNDSGYGVMWFNGRTVGAHRAAWIAANGDVPAGMHVLHRCDNRKCVNPDHLFLGTNADNVADKVAKGRQFRPDFVGSKNNMAKLDEDRVRVIRRLAADGLSNRKIANQFGVSVMTISFIRNNKTWTHVKEVA